MGTRRVSSPVRVLFPDYFDLPPGTPLHAGDRVVLHGRVAEVLEGRHCSTPGAWFRFADDGSRYCFVCGLLPR